MSGDDPGTVISHVSNTVNQNLSDVGNDINAGASKAGNDVNKNASIVDGQVRRTGTDPANEFNAWADTPNGRAALMIAGTAAGGYFLAPAFAGGGAALDATADTGYLGAETAFGTDAAAAGADASIGAGAGLGYLGADTSFADAGIGTASLLGGTADAAAASSSGGFLSSLGSSLGTAIAGTGISAVIGSLFPKKTADPMKASPIVQPMGPSQFAVPSSGATGFVPSVSSIEKFAVPLALLAIAALYISNKKARG